jgi:hypothetical protein
VSAVRFLRHYLPLLLSLLPTPLLLFVSSSADIYLRNQSLLQYQYQVLTPFVKLSLLTLVVGALLVALSKSSRVFRFGLWAYYLAGPVFLVFAFLRGLQETLPGVGVLYTTTSGLAFWPVLLLLSTLVLARRRPSPQLTHALAGFGILLLAYEGGVLFHNIWTNERPNVPIIAAPSPPPNGSPARPNIYHLIFDAYQTDLLDHTITDGAKKALGGFYYFPNNKAAWGFTQMSMANIFSGRRFAYDRSRRIYISQAFGSESSILYWLKSQHYQTVGYVPGSWTSRDRYIDYIVNHDAAAMDDLLALNAESFWNVWLYASTPAALRDTLMKSSWFEGRTEKDLEKLRDGNLLPASTPVTSYLGFTKMMAQEEDLSPTGRYTVAHLLLPHEPFRLRSDCSYNLGSSKTGVIEQSKCTLALIVDFVERLKELGRFDDSLILIHGDHGGFYRTRGGELVANDRARSLDTVLLVKPLGRTSAGELEIRDEQTGLADVPTIILNSVAGRRSGDEHRLPWVPRRSFVPHLERELLSSAEILLKRHGFAVGDVSKVASEGFPEGTVISQDPPAYQAGEGTEAVALVVSSGYPEGQDVVPDFIGRDVAEVTEWLQQRQLPASSIRQVYHPIAAKGMVAAQTPPPGTRTDDGDEIVFYVGRGN